MGVGLANVYTWFLMLICGFKYWCEKCASMEFLGVKLCSFNVYIMRVSIRELQHYKRMNSSKSQCEVIGVLGGSEIRVLDFRTGGNIPRLKKCTLCTF